MRVLNEKDKKVRALAMQTLNVGDDVATGMTKERAKKFLKDIGLSDKKIAELEGKKKPKVEEAAMMPVSSDSYLQQDEKDEKKKKKKSCGCNEQEINESLNECDCQKCDDEKHKKCGKPNKKAKKKKEIEDMTEEVNDKINSVDSAQNALKAKNLQWDKVEKMGNKTIWRKGGMVVGAFDPSWGTVRTGEDILKD